jgi:two-component system sensor histidine kinase KdpD
VDLPEVLPAVAVDPVLANQVIDNLLENVVRHTAADIQVRISAVQDGEAVRVRVEDAGPGVPDDALGHLFEKFYRVPSRRDSARRGTGLGLAVVKGMVEAMGGSVRASASSMGGLAVDLWLPIMAETELPAEPPS